MRRRDARSRPLLGQPFGDLANIPANVPADAVRGREPWRPGQPEHPCLRQVELRHHRFPGHQTRQHRRAYRRPRRLAVPPVPSPRPPSRTHRPPGTRAPLGAPRTSAASRSVPPVCQTVKTGNQSVRRSAGTTFRLSLRLCRVAWPPLRVRSASAGLLVHGLRDSADSDWAKSSFQVAGGFPRPSILCSRYLKRCAAKASTGHRRAAGHRALPGRR